MTDATIKSHANTSSDQQSPLVSVLMPVCNAMPFLPTALESIQNQTYRNVQIVIVDDGSTDDSARVLDEAANLDQRITIIRRGNTGLCVALNEALASATGRYVARMDADDWSHPQRLAEQVDFLEAHPKVIAVGTSIRRVDDADRPICDRLLPDTHNAIEQLLLSGIAGGLTHATAMIRREALMRLSGPYRPEYQGAEDLDLFLRLGEIGEMANLPQVRYHVRMHLASATKTDSQRRLYDLKRRIVVEARRRRGLDTANLQLRHGNVDLAPWQQHLQWARQACRSRFPATARHHAHAAIRLRPQAPQTWANLVMACLPCAVIDIAARCRRWRRQRCVHHAADVL